MAASYSSSSYLSQSKKHHVFPSFHGPDVRRGFLSHLHSIFARKEIPMFKDQEIERGNTIGSELVQAIREARASIVVLSKNYASSIWCLDELLEILKCKEASGQTVLPIFYDVDPSDVRKQKGDFGIAFKNTCEGETEEQKQRWIEAFTYVATVAGEHTRNWNDEAAMLEKISTDVSNKLKVEELKKEFRSCDIDQNGFITAPELRYFLTKDGDKVVTDEEVSAFIRVADVDGDGRISYDEFVKMTMSKIDDEEAAIVKKFATDVKLSREEEEEIMKFFMTLDVDQNGFITAAEYQIVMKNSGKKVTDEEACDFIRAADVDGNGRVSYDEFVKLMTRKTEAAKVKKFATDVKLSREEEEEMMKLFTTLDVDDNGFITAAEYQLVMKNNGKKVTDEEACNSIQVADVDGDGRVSYDEFVKLMTKKTEAARLEKFATDVKLSREEGEEIMKIFTTLDVDDNGFITAAEYQLVMKNSGKKVTDEEACDSIRAADVDGDGRVSYDEFVKLMTKKTEAARLEKFATNVKLSREEEEEIMKIFTTLDVDDNGFITAAEYQLVMKNSGKEVTDEEACDSIRAADVDGDGRISYDEFVKLMTKKTEAARVEKFATHVSNKVDKFVKFMAKALT